MVSTPGPIVFISGAFIDANCWNRWVGFFEDNGYTCMAPAWPGKDRSSEELRNSHPNAAIASNNLTSVTNFFAGIIEALPQQPILIGHSIGGLVVQLLLQRRLGAAGIAVHSFPACGVCKYKISFIRKWWPAMGIFSPAQKSYMVSFRKWKRSFVNSFDCDEQTELFYKYAIPESRRVIKDAFSPAAMINFKQPHAPLLFISGTRDEMIPAFVNYANYKKYKGGESITDYKEFKGRNHLPFEHPAWAEETSFILDWLRRVNNY